jgi:hypothetical protein
MSGLLQRLARTLTEGAPVTAIRPRPLSRFEPMDAGRGPDMSGFGEADTEAPASSPSYRPAPGNLNAHEVEADPMAPASRVPAARARVVTAAQSAVPMQTAFQLQPAPSTAEPAGRVAPAPSDHRAPATFRAAMPAPLLPGTTPRAAEAVVPIAPPTPALARAEGSSPVPALEGAHPVVPARVTTQRSDAHAVDARPAQAPALPSTATPTPPRNPLPSEAREAATPTVVEINIGSVEVRNPTPPRSARPAARRAGPRLGLQAYLDSRESTKGRT